MHPVVNTFTPDFFLCKLLQVFIFLLRIVVFSLSRKEEKGNPQIKCFSLYYTDRLTIKKLIFTKSTVKFLFNWQTLCGHRNVIVTVLKF